MFLSVTTEGQLLGLLNEWAVQILVVFSFALQVFLLMSAWIRRHHASRVLRLLLWLAYQLADSTALFTLGHLSISSRLAKHQLVAFWAPLLLVHLGGQDTITAYSTEDNGIWLRHLQTLFVQLMGAAYVLYKYIPGSEALVTVAAVLIFIVGVLKYVERILALQRASLDSIWSSMDRSDSSVRIEKTEKTLKDLLERRHCLDTEQVLMAAHALLDVCKGLFAGLTRTEWPLLRSVVLIPVVQSFRLGGHLDELMEMELSLMYDIMYTKSAVIHSKYGCCVRVIAPVSMVAAFILFLVSSKEKYNRHDLIISYILLVGAVILEMVSVVRALGSTWTVSLLLYEEKWSWLHQEIRAFRQMVGAARYRRWSGYVGQYNLLRYCSHDTREPADNHQKTTNRSSLLESVSDWWTEHRHPEKPVEVPASTKELVLDQVLQIAEERKEKGTFPGLITPASTKELVLDQVLQIAEERKTFPGLITLQRYGLEEPLRWSIRDIDFEDRIIAWHVATEICLFKQERIGETVQVQAIRLISNYMMFLLVKCRHMLPGPVRHNPCLQVRNALRRLMNEKAGKDASPDTRFECALHEIANSFPEYDDHAEGAGVRLAHILLYHRPTMLKVIFGVWVEMLCYVADHCSRETHSRQLCRGGELVTIVWLMARHADMFYSCRA